jgi:hypothetical protein
VLIRVELVRHLLVEFDGLEGGCCA